LDPRRKCFLLPACNDNLKEKYHYGAWAQKLSSYVTDCLWRKVRPSSWSESRILPATFQKSNSTV